MLLGGLWHGANWTFIAWGAYHGLLLAIERMFGVGRNADRSRLILVLPRIVLTFCLVCIGWVFFRAQSFRRCVLCVAPDGGSRWRAWPVDTTLMVFTVVALLVAVLEESTAHYERLELLPKWSLGMILGVLLLLSRSTEPTAVYRSFTSSFERANRTPSSGCDTEVACAIEQPLDAAQQWALSGGKSGLLRAACRLTAGDWLSKGPLRKVPQKIYRRLVSTGW